MSRRTVTVVATTYRRPGDITELIPMLLLQAKAISDRYDADVIIVDNDPDQGAVDVVAAFADPILRYVHEPRPGIAAARNRALVEATGRDALVFIDDDERPTEGWLEALLETWEATSATAVTGPVVTPYDPLAVDPWLVAGGFLDRRHRAGFSTGRELTNAATNNLLLDLVSISEIGLTFDVDFGLSGGEDTLFTRSLVARGRHIVWCRDAIVTEEIRPERLSRRWMRGRALSYGSTDARIDAAMANGPVSRARARLQSTADGATRVIVGIVISGAGWVGRSLARQAYGQQMMFRGVGLVLGAAGIGHLRYRRSDPVAP